MILFNTVREYLLEESCQFTILYKFRLNTFEVYAYVLVEWMYVRKDAS